MPPARDIHFVTTDQASHRDCHVVVYGRYVGRHVVIDQVFITDGNGRRKTSQNELKLMQGTDPPRYEPA